MIATLALFVGFSPQELPANEAQRVTLHFAWPESGRVRVEATVKEGADAARTAAFDLHWQRKEPHSDYEFRITGGVASFGAEEATWLAEALDHSSSIPVLTSLVMDVDPSGHLCDARYVPQLREDLLGTEAQSRARDEALFESLRKELQSATRHEQALQQAAEMWNPWIASWSGLEVSMVTPVERTREIQWPKTSGTVRHRESITGIGFTEDEDGRWLHARLDSSSDPDAAREALVRTLLDELGAIPEGERIPDLSRRESIEILVDVRTMRPRKVLSVTEMHLDGKLLRRTQSRWVFDWAGKEPR